MFACSASSTKHQQHQLYHGASSAKQQQAAPSTGSTTHPVRKRADRARGPRMTDNQKTTLAHNEASLEQAILDWRCDRRGRINPHGFFSLSACCLPPQFLFTPHTHRCHPLLFDPAFFVSGPLLGPRLLHVRGALQSTFALSSTGRHAPCLCATSLRALPEFR